MDINDDLCSGPAVLLISCTVSFGGELCRESRVLYCGFIYVTNVGYRLVGEGATFI